MLGPGEAPPAGVALDSGASAGTALVARLNSADLGSDPQSFLSIGSRAIFAASDKFGRVAVFATDGWVVGLLALLLLPVAGFILMQRSAVPESHRGDA